MGVFLLNWEVLHEHHWRVFIFGTRRFLDAFLRPFLCVYPSTEAHLHSPQLPAPVVVSSAVALALTVSYPRLWSEAGQGRMGGHGGGTLRGFTLTLLCAATVFLSAESRRGNKQQTRCPVGCTCTKDNALCENIRTVPHTFPPDVVSL